MTCSRTGNNLRGGCRSQRRCSTAPKEAEIRDAGAGRGTRRPGVRCSTAAPASVRAPDVTVGVHAHAEAPTTWSTTRCTPVRPARTAWSPSSRWVARRSSVASVSARWRSGRWKAYGAAYTLQEMLTVKSGRREGRTKIYKNIVGRPQDGARHAGVVQRAGQRKSLARHRHRMDAERLRGSAARRRPSGPRKATRLIT